MTALTRRAALASAGAAVAVAGVPRAIKASQADPVAVLVRKASAYEDWLESIGGTVSDDEFNDLVDKLTEMELRIRDTPATSFEAIAGKVRLAWKSSVIQTDEMRDGPPVEKTDEFYPLDHRRFIWSALQDLERLAVGARS